MTETFIEDAVCGRRNTMGCCSPVS